MRKASFILALAALLGAASATFAGWDFNHDIKHEDDGVTGHENATDFHLVIPVDAGATVTTATASDGSQTSTGTATYSETGGQRTATIDWTFSPAIPRGTTVTFKVEADGTACAPNDAYWTYAGGRGGSILSVGPDYDPGSGTIEWRNGNTVPTQGTVQFASQVTPYGIDLLRYGTLPGFGPPQNFNLAPGGSTVFGSLPPIPVGGVLLVQFAAQGSTGEPRFGVYQYHADAGIPALSPWGLAVIGAGVVIIGSMLIFRRGLPGG